MARSAPGQLERSLAALTLGVAQSRSRRQRMLADGYTGEHEQQVHVPLSGSAGPDWGYADQQINWELPFLYAPLQRRVPFQTPHFTYGFELLNPSGTLMQFDAHVIQWTVSAEAWYTGATVRLAVCAPNTAGAVPYSAIAHLSFQGYATLAEGDEFPP